jgi:hypothetical protein
MKPAKARKRALISLFFKLRVGYLNPFNYEVSKTPTRLFGARPTVARREHVETGRTESLVLE